MSAVQPHVEATDLAKIASTCATGGVQQFLESVLSGLRCR